MAELEANPERVAQCAEQDRRLHERARAFRQAAAPLLEELERAGISTDDFGTFVNRPYPGVLEPARFDAAAATPILLRWLPEIQDARVKEAIVRHLETEAARGVATESLTEAFRVAGEDVQWVIDDTLQAVATKEALIELAADRRHGHGQAQLFDIPWRVKTDRAQEILVHGLEDPDVALVAGSALRRAVGNEGARDKLARLTDHANGAVSRAARENLKRADRALSKEPRA